MKNRIPFIIMMCICMTACSHEKVLISNIRSEKDERSTAVTEAISGYADADWHPFIRYQGRSYTGAWEPVVIDEANIGEQLGVIARNPPGVVPLDYEIPNNTVFGYEIGTKFYAVSGMDTDYGIAAFDWKTETYHLFQYEEFLPMQTQIVRCGLWEYNVYPTVQVIETYEDFQALFDGDIMPDAFAAYDKAFFEDNVLAAIHLYEGSGSIRHAVNWVKRRGEEIEIGIQRSVPEIGTADIAYWFIAAAIDRTAWDGSAVTYTVTNEYDFE